MLSVRPLGQDVDGRGLCGVDPAVGIEEDVPCAMCDDFNRRRGAQGERVLRGNILDNSWVVILISTFSQVYCIAQFNGK